MDVAMDEAVVVERGVVVDVIVLVEAATAVADLMDVIVVIELTVDVRAATVAVDVLVTVTVADAFFAHGRAYGRDNSRREATGDSGSLLDNRDYRNEAEPALDSEAHLASERKCGAVAGERVVKTPHG